MSDEPKPNEPRRVHVASSAEREARRAARAKQKALEAEKKKQALAESVEEGSTAAPPTDKAEPEKKKKTGRGIVCPKCGKYHDVSARKVGDTFNCYCGQELVVTEAKKEATSLKAVQVAELNARIRKLRFATGLAAGAGVVLVLIGVTRLYESGFRVPPTIALVIGIGFVGAALAIRGETKKTTEELAELEA